MSFSVLTALGVFGQATIMQSMAAPVSTSELAAGKQKMSQGKLVEAISLLKKAVEKQPNSCECHLCLGKAICQKAKADKGNKAVQQLGYINARNELRKAIRIGKGNVVAKEANQYMMTNIPPDLLRPKVGEGTEMIAAMLGVTGRTRGLGEASKPKVFEFYADWCEPCKMLKPVIEKAKATYGEQVEFVSYNVDDQKNADFIDQYEVSPIPTIIFLSPDNQVVGYSIGFSGEKPIQKNLEKILPANKS